MPWLQLRPSTKLNPGGQMVVLTFAIATAGLLILALDSILFDRTPIIVLSAVAIAALIGILVIRLPILWLAVGGIWIYATIMEAVRAPTVYEKWGLGLVFFAIAFGSLAAHVQHARGEL